MCLEELPKLGHISREGELKDLTSTRNSNFRIFQGEFFSDLGGNETSASFARMAIRMSISGFCCPGRVIYNWYLS